MNNHLPTLRCHMHQGFTLVEMMVALLLGFIVIAGAVSIFLGNQRVYHTNAALAEVQDNARIAFEMMAHDIRQAGLTGCVSTPPLRVADVLNNGPAAARSQRVWWGDWVNSLHGYSQAQYPPDPALRSTGDHRQTQGTDSLQLMSAADAAVSVNGDVVNGRIPVNGNRAHLHQGDVVLICDPDHVALLQLSQVGNGMLGYNAGTDPSPGNCSLGLGYPTNCGDAQGKSYTFGSNAQLARLSVVDWYICATAGGDNALCRKNVQYRHDRAQLVTQEMVPHVRGMKIHYHRRGQGNFVSAGDIRDNWSKVDAVRVTLALTNDNRSSLRMNKVISFTTYVRNREARR